LGGLGLGPIDLGDPHVVRRQAPRGREKGNLLCDHAVVVTGVNTANGKVQINDGGMPDGKDETVSIARTNSWATSEDRSTAGGYTQYGTRARYCRIARAASSQPTAVSTSTTTQCRSSW
jgi:hypothetical protein